MSTEIKFSANDVGDNNEILSQTGIVEFKVGMKVEVDYVNPTAGWAVIWLQDNKDNVVLTFSARIGAKELILNSRIDGKWGCEEKPSGYDFTPGASQHVSLESANCHFIIRVNNKTLHCYNDRLTPTSICKVTVHYYKSGSAAAQQLKGVTYKY